MNIANKITLLRILLIPIFIVFLMINKPFYREIALLIFIIASLTDKLDGYYARKLNLITDLGKFMDPLADKLLVTSALLMFIEMGIIEAWIVFIILAREFAVTGLRAVAATNNVVIAASQLGKLKTVAQITAIIVLLLNNFPFNLIGLRMDTILIYFSLIITIVSGIDYFLKNRKIFVN
jgi:CDP-diacylglycerol--glycerol-3-phosphate 3-phosphatidyltransferase